MFMRIKIFRGFEPVIVKVATEFDIHLNVLSHSIDPYSVDPSNIPFTTVLSKINEQNFGRI